LSQNIKAASSRPAQHFDVMDVLRGVAAATVLVGHAMALIVGHSYFERKYLAVEFFFMLSGFVVGFSYEARMKAGMSANEFYLRRAIRLYPLIIAGTVIGAVWLQNSSGRFLSDPLRYVEVVLSALALPSPQTAYSLNNFPINLPEWSLFYELVAYGVFGALILRTRSRHLIALAAAGFAFFAVNSIAVFDFGQDDTIWSRSFGATAAFSLGVLLWRFHERGMLPSLRLPFSVMALLLFTSCVLPTSMGWEWDVISVGLLFPILIISSVNYSGNSIGRFGRLLGELSYPVYILHWPFLQFSRRVFLDAIGSIGTIIIGCSIAVIVSWIALVIYDRPMRRWLTSRLLRRQKSVSAMA
jgi:peptidoglycan/LPS O-acetylase OafA/YrhL